MQTQLLEQDNRHLEEENGFLRHLVAILSMLAGGILVTSVFCLFYYFWFRLEKWCSERSTRAQRERLMRARMLRIANLRHQQTISAEGDGYLPMTKVERNSILQYYFSKRIFLYGTGESPSSSSSNNGSNDITKSRRVRFVTNDDLEANDADEDVDATDATTNDAKKQQSIEKHNDRLCSICLLEYESNDKVMTGTSCNHLFHYHCCIEWMQQGDMSTEASIVAECPICRYPFIRPNELEVARIDWKCDGAP